MGFNYYYLYKDANVTLIKNNKELIQHVTSNICHAEVAGQYWWANGCATRKHYSKVLLPHMITAPIENEV